MRLHQYLTLAVSTITIVITGCSTQQAFSTAARAGDTIAIPIGSQPEVSRSTLSLEFTPCTGTFPTAFRDTSTFPPIADQCINPAGPTITYPIGDARIRSVLNTYPDPISGFVVNNETNSGFSSAWLLKAAQGGNNEFVQTTVLVDLPDDTLLTSPGLVAIRPIDSSGTPFKLVAVDILTGTGGSNPFLLNGISVQPEDVQSLERPPHYVVSFSGTTTPVAIEVTLKRPAGMENTGITYPVSPRADLTQLSWSDDGTTLTVMLLPASTNMLVQDIQNLKFYIGGEPLATLTVDSVAAYDIDGNPVSGVTAALTSF